MTFTMHASLSEIYFMKYIKNSIARCKMLVMPTSQCLRNWQFKQIFDIYVFFFSRISSSAHAAIDCFPLIILKCQSMFFEWCARHTAASTMEKKKKNDRIISADRVESTAKRVEVKRIDRPKAIIQLQWTVGIHSLTQLRFCLHREYSNRRLM